METETSTDKPVHLNINKVKNDGYLGGKSNESPVIAQDDIPIVAGGGTARNDAPSTETAGSAITKEPPVPLGPDLRDVEVAGEPKKRKSAAPSRGVQQRRRVAGAVALALAASAGVGWVAASRVKSPAQIAAKTAPPVASLITYAVQQRVLSSDLIARGTVRYSEPTPIVLSPSLLKLATQLVSSIPQKGGSLNEGDVALVVSGRPVFVLAGPAPGFRDLGPGVSGPDVAQLEASLKRLGHDPGPLDGTYDASTASAVADWYTKAGYTPFGPSDAQLTGLRLAQSALSQATDRFLQAQQIEIVSRQGAKPAEIIDGKAAVTSAEAALVAARGALTRETSRASAEIALKEAALEAATVSLDDAQRRVGFANSGVNASTGLALSADQLAQLQDGIDDSVAALSGAESDLAASRLIADNVRATANATVEEATIRVAAAAVPGGQLTALQMQDISSAVRTAQSAVALADATAAKETTAALNDVQAKQTASTTAAAKAAATPGDASLAAAADQAAAELAAANLVLESTRRSGAAATVDAQTKLSAAIASQGAAATVQETASAVKAAQANLAVTQAVAAKDVSVADADVSAKSTMVAASKARLSQARRRLESAKAGVDPVTGQPLVSPNDRASAQSALKQADNVLKAARRDLSATKGLNELASVASRIAIQDAGVHLNSARLRLIALRNPPVPTAALIKAVQVASVEVTRLRADMTKVSATVGIQVPANEILFFGSLPLRVDDTKIKRGDSASGEVMTVSGTRLAIDSSLLATEASLTKAGANVVIDAPDFNFTGKGTLSFLADKPGLRGTDAQHIAIEVSPESAPSNLIGASVRLTIPTKTTGTAALVVPLAALSIRADGATQLQVEEANGSVRTVIVAPGLSAQGFVAVTVVTGSLRNGDRVVVGSNQASSGVNPTGAAASSAA